MLLLLQCWALLLAPSEAVLAPFEVVLCVVAVRGRYERGVAVTIGVVVVVAVVVHVAKCLAVFAVPPSVHVHRVDLVETAGV